MTPRFAGLDGLRAVAASLVFVHHAGFATGVTFTSRMGDFIGRMDVGVPIFFVLSGFLLGRPFARAIVHREPQPGLGRYYRRRFLRIAPAYWVALVLMLVIGGISVGGFTGFLHAATLTSLYRESYVLSGLVQAWSIGTEVAFYAALPVLALAGARFAGAGTTSGDRARRLLVGIIAVYLVSVTWRVLVEVLDPPWAAISRQWLPAQADHFALGMGLAVLSAWGELRPHMDAVLRRIGASTEAWWAASLVLFWYASTQLDLEVGLAVAPPANEGLRQLTYGLVALCLVAPLALAPQQRGGIRRLLDNRVMAWLGVVSYGFFLWHLYVLTWIMRWFDWEVFTGHFVPLVAMAFPLSVLAAWLSYRLVERPASGLFDRRDLQQTGAGVAGPPVVASP
jgi:peptidoglycan/LPS O-acetylase OafA/YrhL